MKPLTITCDFIQEMVQYMNAIMVIDESKCDKIKSIRLILVYFNENFLIVTKTFHQNPGNEFVKEFNLRKHNSQLPEFIYFVYLFTRFIYYQNGLRQCLQKFLEDKYKRTIPECSTVNLCFIIDQFDLSSIAHIDTKWCNRIQYLATLRMDLEESLSWLSTLGGAYSSLGDKHLKFAQQAERISMSQMRLSYIYGDPNLTGRCMIYLGHSWSQQGHRKKAIKMIKSCLYPFLVQLGPNCDIVVKRMYQALCFRIRFIYKR